VHVAALAAAAIKLAAVVAHQTSKAEHLSCHVSAAAACAVAGKYELQGVLTHKGRSADSGHYVSWVKQQDGSWVLFDDDELIIKKDEDVLALCGGGDWHMAYLLLYRAIRVPEGAEAAPAAAAPAAAAAAAPKQPAA
jgi:ubiquitin carboxyl-terminal hydrolase 14